MKCNKPLGQDFANDIRAQRIQKDAVTLRASKMNITRPVFDFETVTVDTVIDNQADLAELILRLETIKAMLPKAETPPGAGPDGVS